MRIGDGIENLIGPSVEDGGEPDEADEKSEKKALQIHETYRDYIKHEDGLINQRMSWFIWLHSFLIIAYANLFGSFLASFDLAVGTPWRLLLLLRVLGVLLILAISAVGCLSSIAAWSAVGAAREAINALRKRGEGELANLAPAGLWLPRLTGGGAEGAAHTGHRLGYWLPAALIWTWGCSLIVPATLAIVTVASAY